MTAAATAPPEMPARNRYTAMARARQCLGRGRLQSSCPCHAPFFTNGMYLRLGRVPSSGRMRTVSLARMRRLMYEYGSFTLPKTSASYLAALHAGGLAALREPRVEAEVAVVRDLRLRVDEARVVGTRHDAVLAAHAAVGVHGHDAGFRGRDGPRPSADGHAGARPDTAGTRRGRTCARSRIPRACRRSGTAPCR